MTSDISSPDELAEFDSFDLYGYYEGWELDEQRVRECRPRLEQIFGLSFTLDGRVAYQDGSLLCTLYAHDACRAAGAFGEYINLSLCSFSFSMFGRLFAVAAASQHPAVTPERVGEATNVFRELGFVYCADSILQAPYVPYADAPEWSREAEGPDTIKWTWADRYFSSAF